MKRTSIQLKPISDRGGVTLTEVLMSLMIMSIGVASVATLFPIAALRSAQATKLTNGAILKYNVEALIRARPELVFDPDGDFMNSSPASAGYWNRLTEHFRTNAEKNYIVDPSGYFTTAGIYDDYGTVTSAGSGTTYNVNAVAPASRLFSDYFGNTAAPAAGTGTPTPYAVLPRYDGGIRALGLPMALSATTLRNFETVAADLSNLGDGWDTVVDDVAVGYKLSDGSITAAPVAGDLVVGVVLDSEIDLSSVVTSSGYASVLSIDDPEYTLITVFRADGKISQSFPLTRIAGTNECEWTESLAATDFNGNGITDLRPLPVEFFNGTTSQYEIGRVVIQARRPQDFNWMLTVRREADGRASGVDVVVIFSDGRKPDNERVFPATFTEDAFGVTIAKTSGVDLNGDPAEPFLKRGAFILDVENARWYRITNYQENPADSTQYLITTESAAVESSPGGLGGAMILPGVVEVYPLGSIPLPESMTLQTF